MIHAASASTKAAVVCRLSRSVIVRHASGSAGPTLAIGDQEFRVDRSLQKHILSLQDGINLSLFEAMISSLPADEARSLDQLLRMGLLEYIIESLLAPADEPELRIQPHSTLSQWRVKELADADLIRWSKFACLRGGANGFRVETPRVAARIHLSVRSHSQLVAHLAREQAVSALLASAGQAWRPLVEVLAGLGVVTLRGADNGSLAGDEEERLQHWEPHDLWFYSRTRSGLHASPTGRIANTPRRPVMPPVGPSTLLPTLPAPRAFIRDVFARRSSARVWGVPSLERLAQFLDLALRTSMVDGRVRRPYPSGGGVYEIEFNIIVQACSGLPGGHYLYDSVTHRLVMKNGWSNTLAELLEDARRSMAATAPPPILIVFGAEFSQLSDKYRSIAYSTLLKNVGSAMATMAFVAEALEMSFCPIGNGNIVTFEKLSGRDLFEYGSVGEVAVGERT